MCQQRRRLANRLRLFLPRGLCMTFGGIGRCARDDTRSLAPKGLGMLPN